MKLLVSVINPAEAKRGIAAGADIIDIKNPQEGSLGGHSPRVIKKIRVLVSGRRELSAAIGDIDNRPGLVSQAALGLAGCGLGYIKMGLCDSFNFKQAASLVREVVKTVRSRSRGIKIVACAYADAKTKGLFRPERLPNVAYRAGADIAMIDTLTKGNGKSLFDYISEKSVSAFCSRAHKYGLKTALAGNLREKDILKIKKMGCCDIVGIRALACRNGKRNQAVVASKIKAVKKILSN